MGWEERIEYLEQINRWYDYALEVFSDINQMFGKKEEQLSPEFILEKTRNFALKLFRFETISFYLIDQETAEFRFMGCHPASETEFIQKKIEELIEAKEFSWALNQNKSVIFPIKKQNRNLILHVIASKKQPRGMFVATLPKDNREFSDGSLRLLSLLLHNTGYALESAELYHLLSEKNKKLEEKVSQSHEELAHRHFHDQLTELPNRFLFFDRLEQAILRAERSTQYVVVLILDLDMFKVINETLGHQLGDEVLKQVATRLKGSLRGYDTLLRLEEHTNEITVSRIGSDEFGFLLTDIHQLDDVLHVVHRILQVISAPFEFHEHKIFMTSSIGISVFPEDGVDAKILMQNAELAMHHAKKKGKNCYQFFSKEMNKSAYTYFKMGSELHQALEKEEFVLHFQPIIDLKTGSMVGMEALIRWMKDGKLIYPDNFIPLAEEMGLIGAIGWWVIQRSCYALDRFEKIGYPNLKIALNLSAEQFKAPSLVENLNQLVLKKALKPHQIELEITERTLMEDVGLTVNILEDLHLSGFKVAIDDFGTGYSSLNYLKKFKVDLIKIDKSFIADVLHNTDDQAIVQAIIGLAHTLGLALVAEGIETLPHAQYLKKLGCEYGQGYYFARPMDELALLKFIKNYQYYQLS